MSLLDEGPLVPLDGDVGVDAQHAAHDEEGRGRVDDPEEQCVQVDRGLAGQDGDERADQPGRGEDEAVPVPEIVAVDELGGGASDGLQVLHG